MTKSQLENLVADLMKQNSTQGDLLTALIEKMFISPSTEQESDMPPTPADDTEPEPTPRPEPRRAPRPAPEPYRSPAQRRLEHLRESILSHFDPDKSPKILTSDTLQQIVKRYHLDSLEDVALPLFCGLVSKYLTKPLAEAFYRGALAKALYRQVVRFIDLGLEEGELEIDDEVQAEAAAFEQQEATRLAAKQRRAPLEPSPGRFTLPGRDELERFLNDHVVDLVNHHADYLALGIDFPSAFILEGPPGCGKTFAIDRLAEHLGWPIFRVNSTSIGSSYVHETAKKIESVFEEAAQAAPSIVIVDEMDAFTPNRATLSRHDDFRNEEVAAFLRCLQEAASRRVLVVGMTNLIDKVDPAIKRSGRMGAHITLGMPSQPEVEAVLRGALGKRPHEDFPLEPIAARLLDRPIADITALVDIAAMATARARRPLLTESDLTAALGTLSSQQHSTARPAIGFAS